MPFRLAPLRRPRWQRHELRYGWVGYEQRNQGGYVARSERLRPVERRVLAMHRHGIGTPEIADRFRRSPQHVKRVIEWTGIKRAQTPERRHPRAIEQRVVTLRDAGETYEQIGGRFKRSPRFIRQVEGLTHVVNGTTTTLVEHGAELLKDAAGQARDAATART